MKVFFGQLFFLFACLFIWACDDGAFRPEQFSKTRPLGMASDPISLSPGTTGASLTLHIASPLGTSISWTKTSLMYISVAGVPTEITTTNSFATSVDYSTLSHHQGLISFDVPNDDSINPTASTGIPLFYELTFTDGSNSIDIKGKAVVYGTGHEALNYSAHSITIDSPTDSVANNEKQNLNGTIAKGQEESIKVSWIVPNGKIENRRDITTIWQPDTAAAATIILSVRGRDSQAMAVGFKDIVIN
jgi:hypothetical protein